MKKIAAMKFLKKSFMISVICLLVLVPAKAQALTVSYNASFTSTGVVDVTGGGLNIRSKASTSGTVVGSFKNHAGAKIKKTVSGSDGKWYLITSGSVKGYAKAAYFLTGKAGSAAAKKYGTSYYAVNVDALRMRSKASTSSSVVATLKLKQKVTRLNNKTYTKNGYTWVYVKAVVNGKTYKGYVVKKYLKRYITLADAVSYSSNSESTASNNSNSNSAAPTTSTTPSVNTVNMAAIGSKLVSTAKSYVGKLNYVYGGTSLTTGADCSGFVQSIYRLYGISIPRTSVTQAVGGRSILRSDLRLGDLVFYGNSNGINHVAMYIGNGQIVHCANPDRDCVINNMDYMAPMKYVTYIH